VLQLVIDELEPLTTVSDPLAEILRQLSAHVGLDSVLLQARKDDVWRVLARLGGSAQGGGALSVPGDVLERLETGLVFLSESERHANWLAPLLGNGEAASVLLLPVTSVSHGSGVLVGISSTAAGAEQARLRAPLLRRCLSLASTRADALVLEARRNPREPTSEELAEEKTKDLAYRTESLRQQDAALLQAQKLEAISQLASAVAHDFNNVLGTIVGTSDLLLMDPVADPQMKDGLELVRDAGLRATELTRRLLVFSRKRALERQLLDLGQVIEDFAPRLRRLLGPEHPLRLELSPGVPLVHAERSQLEQVLLNLVLNSMDALPDGGTVRVALDQLQGSPAGNGPSGHWVRLLVQDDGVGISASDLPRVFEPFFTTKDPKCHVGLGLSTVWGIMKHHEGHVSARSENGHGCSVVVLLPPAVT